jgi:hypothetical protein
VSELVQVAVGGDVAEAEQIQEMLAAAGIEASLEPTIDEEGVDPEHVKVLVAESSVEAARDAIEAMSEPDDAFEA